MTFTAEPNIGSHLVEAMINSDRQMWGGSPISFPNGPQWNK